MTNEEKVFESKVVTNLATTKSIISTVFKQISLYIAVNDIVSL